MKAGLAGYRADVQYSSCDLRCRLSVLSLLLLRLVCSGCINVVGQKTPILIDG